MIGGVPVKTMSHKAWAEKFAHTKAAAAAAAAVEESGWATVGHVPDTYTVVSAKQAAKKWSEYMASKKKAEGGEIPAYPPLTKGGIPDYGVPVGLSEAEHYDAVAYDAKSVLTKSATVLDYAGVVGDGVKFTYTDDDTGEVTKGLVLPWADWTDMGQPVEVTVTIEPGNTLKEQ